MSNWAVKPNTPSSRGVFSLLVFPLAIRAALRAESGTMSRLTEAAIRGTIGVLRWRGERCSESQVRWGLLPAGEVPMP